MGFSGIPSIGPRRKRLSSVVDLRGSWLAFYDKFHFTPTRPSAYDRPDGKIWTVRLLRPERTLARTASRMFRSQALSGFRPALRGGANVVLMLAAGCLWLQSLPNALADGEGERAFPLPMHLQVTWQLESPLTIHPEVAAADAIFSHPANLCLESTTSGALRISASKQAIRFHPPCPLQTGGFEFRLQPHASDALRLNVQLAAEGPAASADQDALPQRTITEEISLTELRAGPVTVPVAGQGNLQITRAPEDTLQVNLHGDRLVFGSGQTVPFDLVLSPVDGRLPHPTVEVLLAIRKARSGQLVDQQKWLVSVEPTGRLQIPQDRPLRLPAGEGAYELQWRCVRPSRGGISALRTDLFLLRDDGVFASRSFQVVVIEDQQPESTAVASRLVARIQPLRRSWSLPRVLPEVPGFPSVNSLLNSLEPPTSSVPLGEDLHAGESIAVISPGGWYASPLPIVQPGVPHTLILRYPNGRAMRLGVSIMQPDADGQLPPTGTYTGIAVAAPVDQASADRWSEHRIVFWPRCRKPYVVLTNQETKEPVRFESIRIEAGPLVPSLGSEPLPGAETFGRFRSQGQGGRLAALYLDKPLINSAFGDGGQLDPDSSLVIEDWHSYLIAGQRLVEYLQWAGFNAAIVNVAGNGSSLYPCDFWSATPQLQTARLASRGRDPMPKDVVELYLRLFARAGLRLIPALDLNMPTRRLDQVAGQQPDSGIRPTDAWGRTPRTDFVSGNGVIAQYNFLHSSVQEELIQIIDYFNQRYKTHPSFVGVGLQLHGGSFAQPTPLSWNQDRNTVDRFRRWASKQETVSENAPTERLSEEELESFADWRAAQVSSAYHALADRLGERRLFLLPTEFDDHDGVGFPRGLDWGQIGQHPRIVPLGLVHESVFDDIARYAAAAEADALRHSEKQLTAAKAAGRLVFRPPTITRGIDVTRGISPVNTVQTVPVLTHPTPVQRRYRQQLIGSFEDFDAQVLAVGGWTVPLGQEAATRELFRSFTQLPAATMATVPAENGAPSSLRVRQWRGAEQSVISVVNLAPWPLAVDLEFDQEVDFTSLKKSHSSAQRGNGAAQNRHMLLVEPGQLVAGRTDRPACLVTWRERRNIDPQTLQRISDRVQDLAARVALLTTPRVYPELLNGSFSELADQSIPGWMVAQHPPGSVQLASLGFDDKHSLLLTNSSNNAKTWAISSSFRPPATGRLAVSLQARCLVQTPSTAPLSLQVSIEGRRRDQPFRSSKTFQPRTDGNWQIEPLMLEIPRLPDDDIEDLRLTIDLLTPGKVWIDDVRLYDFFLTPAERTELQSQTFLAAKKMRQGDLTAAAKLFDSYWGRFLMGLTIATGSVDPGGAEAEGSPLPGIAERLRNWLPNPLR